MEIRELAKKEIKKAVKFYEDVVCTTEGKEAGMNNFEKDIIKAFKEDHILIAVEGEDIIGFSWSKMSETKNKKKIDKVIMLLISPDKYGVGVGGSLMEKEREYARKKGADVFDIEVG